MSRENMFFSQIEAKTDMKNKSKTNFSLSKIDMHIAHCLKITKNVAFEFFNFEIFHQFCRI